MAPKSISPPTAGRNSSILWMPECSGFLLACLLSFTLQIFFFSPAVSSAFLHQPTSNSLEGFNKLGLGLVNDPEDVAVGTNGLLYTATKDGWIKRMHKDFTWENWKQTGSTTLLGITTTKENDVIVCDSTKGLLKVTEAGVTVLISGLSFPNDVIEASDGSLYFTISSSKYTPAEYYVDLVEGKPYGELHKYDPSTKKDSILATGFYFANGIALSKDEDFVIVCESWKFRCRRYWLKGERKGKVEEFIENLPGGPDNINLAADGSFWISLININGTGVKALQGCKENMILLKAYPELISLLVPLSSTSPAKAVKVTSNGKKIIREFSDPNATYTPFVTSTLEYQGSLYMAGPSNNFIGNKPLNSFKVISDM